MADRVKEIGKQILEWWNKFSAKQKTFIIAAGAGVIIAIAILAAVLTQPQYTLLLSCETTKEASEVVALLEEEGLDFKVSDDGYRIDINVKDQSDASLLLGANDIQAATYTIDNVTDGGFTTTESDKQKRYELYLETRIADDMIARFTAVKSAVVDIYIPENDGTLIQSQEESSAWILLELDGEFSTESAAFLAKAVAKAMGNETEENIVILDMDGNMLFSGDASYSATGTASSQLGVKTQWETQVKNEIKQVLLGTNEFDKVEVASNLDISFSSSEVTDHEYYVADGNTQGYKSSDRTYTSESTTGVGGVPGTDSNGDIEYVYEDDSESSTTVEETENHYLPSERITKESNLPGAINYEASSIAITAISYNVIREEDIEAQGLLDGITWEEYKLANAEGAKLEVEDEMYEIVAKATGFPKENIAFAARTENIFFDKEGLGVDTSDIIQIVLIIIILALLAFVVIRSMRSDKEVEQPEELSVETLLQSQPEMELEDIGTEQISETRRMIEKFIDENPEAAANLLRNWLNQDWG
ncbi:MAG: flagellar M-ring protein FliF [Lachnospiraceae bacterium]|nr:flagellar M-ring protein FliF [Lachnospiraceae bacterium]